MTKLEARRVALSGAIGALSGEELGLLARGEGWFGTGEDMTEEEKALVRAEVKRLTRQIRLRLARI